MAPQYKLTYFDIRALAEPIRLIFALKGVEYEDIRIPREEWSQHKQDPQFPWGTLPVLQVGDKALAQSGAIQRYLAKQFDLNGSDDFEAAKCDEMIEAMGDLRQAFFKHVFEADETKKEEMLKTLKSETFPKFLMKYEAILQANNGFLVGSKVSYADLNVAAFLQIFGEHLPDLLEPYAGIKAHQGMVFSLNGIKEWVAKRPATKF